MISVAEADLRLKNILKNLSFETETLPLMQSLGHILAEDILADRDFPPFNRVMMDGIALRFEAFSLGKRAFRIADIAAAGQSQKILTDPSNDCIEIMTGAVLPEGCDTVIRYEDLQHTEGGVKIMVESIVFQQNIHFKGTNKKENDVVVPKGKRLNASDISTAATVGKAFLKVAKLPRIAVISTGNELVSIEETPELHQIRRSNVWAVTAFLKENFGVVTDMYHLNDDETDLENRVGAIIEQHDICIFSGAVSAGKYDFLPKILEKLGISTLFHQVAQRPAKPLFVGTFAHKVIFGLPGNPVSTYLSTVRYIKPFLQQYLGEKIPPPQYATLTETVFFKPAMTYFLPVKIAYTEGGQISATPAVYSGSGDLAALNDANAFVELPNDGRTEYKKGDSFLSYGF